ncbi:MAG: hypothetical protein JRF69_08890 [Deltaproteobacteria bacterium]|nr:hypothetical protein [Deltaproteobacteria bacterium]
MTLQEVRSMLAWCTVMNFGLLIWWFLFLSLAHDWTYRMHRKWCNISVEKFDAFHYAGISFFKVFVFAFNLVPYLALRIVG